jgi:hypothetical protein
MLLANCHGSVLLEHKGHFHLSLENQFINSIWVRVKIVEAHLEDANRARPSSFERGTVAQAAVVAGNEPFTIPGVGS